MSARLLASATPVGAEPLERGMLFEPVAKLGYNLDYCGHHVWWLGAAWHE